MSIKEADMALLFKVAQYADDLDLLEEKVDMLKDIGYVNLSRGWDKICRSLSVQEIVNLLKTMVVAEKKLKWIGGSCSSAIWIFDELEARSRQACCRITPWIVGYSTNIYVPYGTALFRSRSYHEYCAYIKDREERSIKHKKLEAIWQEEAKKRIIEKRLNHEQRMEEQLRYNQIREDRLASLQPLTAAQRLRAIALDNERPLLYYPNEYAAVAESEIRGMEEDTFNMIFNRTKVYKRTCWYALCEKMKKIKAT